MCPHPLTCIYNCMYSGGMDNTATTADMTDVLAHFQTMATTSHVGRAYSDAARVLAESPTPQQAADTLALRQAMTAPGVPSYGVYERAVLRIQARLDGLY